MHTAEQVRVLLPLPRSCRHQLLPYFRSNVRGKARTAIILSCVSTMSADIQNPEAPLLSQRLTQEKAEELMQGEMHLLLQHAITVTVRMHVLRLCNHHDALNCRCISL